MGLFDWMKKKPEQKKAEQKTMPAAQSTTPPVENAPSIHAEEVAEKIMILIPYIRQYRAQNMTDEEIVRFLLEHDWPELVVRKALKYA